MPRFLQLVARFVEHFVRDVEPRDQARSDPHTHNDKAEGEGNNSAIIVGRGLIWAALPTLRETMPYFLSVSTDPCPWKSSKKPGHTHIDLTHKHMTRGHTTTTAPPTLYLLACGSSFAAGEEAYPNPTTLNENVTEWSSGHVKRFSRLQRPALY